MINRNSVIGLLIALAALAAPFGVQAQTNVSEDFTKTTTNNSWWFFNGACLTASTLAGSEPSSGSGGQIPGCTTIATSYYNKTAGEVLVGGQGLTNTTPDPVGKGALRFTNGYPYGYKENGGIVFATPFPTGQGVAITFKTVTYLGNSGGSLVNGNGDDGADGISFYLMDASQLNTSTITGVSSGNGNGLGSWGGSLGYTCSNSNTPYNGLIGGYVGVGIDEYGNFLNGTTNTLSESGTTASGDNTATGGGYQPGRIGVRGAGNIAWATLTGAYGTNPNNSADPYYPASLATGCANAGGTYNSTTGWCQSCSSGTYTNTGSGNCIDICASGTNYNSTSGGECQSCNDGATYSGTGSGSCKATSTTCADVYGNGYALNAGDTECVKGATDKAIPTSASLLVNAAPTTASPGQSPTDAMYAVQNTCKNGTLYNYASATAPTSAGATALTNSVNKGLASANIPPILDYTALPGGFVALPSASFTASVAGNLMTVSAVSSGTVAVGEVVSGSGVPAGTFVQGLVTGSGTTGTYTLNQSATIAKEAMTGVTQIANESAATRSAATPINYQLKISQNGLLSLSYAICPPTGCGAYQAVMTKQNITTSNGPLPANFLFGFAGSTGGSSNIHEILCFQAEPATSASSSAGASEKQSAKVETGVQVYFAYYNPSNGFTGRVTASSLGYDQYGNITIASVPNWDASCVLTGVGAGFTCSTTLAQGPIAAEPVVAATSPATSREILTWDTTNLVGLPFEWNNLNTNQQTWLDAGDPTTNPPPCNSSTAYAANERLNFLRGDRSCEVNSSGVGLFRRRASVLADIIDSSPIWVGAPDAPYASVWVDRLNPQDPLPENAATAQSYATYTTAETNRQPVVYVGANDGLMHGFRSGIYNSATSTFTNNDGYELLAYMPGYVTQTIHSTTASVDYPNPQYGHNFFVDSTPATGDVFFNGQWHTWLVSGLGPGGSSIFALDITNPGNFLEGNAASLVLGEWTGAASGTSPLPPSTITCVNTTAPNAGTCYANLGQTYGTPVIRRLHDGNWAFIFGNGLNSPSGDAGIFIGVLNPNTGKPTFYYLSTSTGSPTSPNGIAYAAAADLDGDHITDYVYAGDIQGNVWRFDLTSSVEANWAVTSPGPLFKTPSNQPITTAVVVASGAPSAGMQPLIMLLFGTGQKFPLTNASAATYASGTQSLYGVWDWNMTNWNSISTSATYAALSATATGLSGNDTMTQANLQYQSATIGASGDVDINVNATICWAGQTGCTGSSAQFGWYLNLPSAGEQVIYSPELVNQAITVNTIVPATNTPTSCTILSDQGYTYVLSALTGGAFNQVFLPPSEAANPNVNTNQAYLDKNAIGMLTDATGSSFVSTSSSGTEFLIFETNQTEGSNGNVLQGQTMGLNLPPNNIGRRLNWVELR
jgi:type IV pilus assembly protein PilY1